MLQIMYTAAPWLRDFSEWYGALPCHSVNGKNASKSFKSCQRYIASPKIVEIVRCTYIFPESWCNLSFLLFFVRFYLPFYRARFSFDRAQFSCAFFYLPFYRAIVRFYLPLYRARFSFDRAQISFMRSCATCIVHNFVPLRSHGNRRYSWGNVDELGLCTTFKIWILNFKPECKLYFLTL